MQHTFITNVQQSNSRLDTALWKYLSASQDKEAQEFSRSRIAVMIREQGALVSGKPVYNPAKRLTKGEEVVFSTAFPQKTSTQSTASAPVEVLKETEGYVVVNKPAGMLVYAPEKSPTQEKTLVQALLDAGYLAKEHFSETKEDRIGIVHRLDRNTSGALVVARNQETLEILQKAFRERKVTKEYLALTEKELPEKSGSIDLPIHTKKGSIKRFSRLYTAIQSKLAQTQKALTEYRLIKAFPKGAFYLVGLITGRTHQIRVHFSALGAPIWGDDLYGGKNERKKQESRQYLHAWRLTFPAQEGSVQVIAPLPEDFVQLLKSLDENPKARYDNEALEKEISMRFS